MLLLVKTVKRQVAGTLSCPPGERHGGVDKVWLISSVLLSSTLYPHHQMSNQFLLGLPIFIFKKLLNVLKFQANKHTLISSNSQGQCNNL